MSFYLPSDPGFAEAVRIRRGEANLDPTFDSFMAGFAEAFGIRPLTLMIDSMPRPGNTGVTPRLGVILERTFQSRAFYDKSGYNFDRAKQSQTARLFAARVPEAGLARRFGLPLRLRRTNWAEELFVYFADFEQTAKWAAHDSVTGAELESFIARLQLGDQFWCTERFSGPPIVFVHTDDQAAQLKLGDTQDRWADLYYPLVHGHDEFGYISRGEILIRVDSKETFDRDYSGNWYYYFK